MADIELVIKIPEEIKEDIDNYRDMEFIELPYLIYIIRKGTPLPKGHGRLIDADALDIDNLDCAYDGNFELDYGRLYTEDVVNMIESALTIIEADKAENKEYGVNVINRGNCMLCGKKLTEGLFFCKECEAKGK